MALAPWEIDAGQVKSTGSTAPTSSSSDTKYRDSGSYTRQWKPPSTSSTTSRSSGYGGGGGGGSSTARRTTSSSSRSTPSSSSSTTKREVTKRTPGPLPLTAEELAAFQDQRRAITRQAEANIANAERARKAALEQFVGNRFGLQSEAQNAMRNTALQGSAMGRGQARSGLAIGSQMQDIQRQLTGGLGQLNRNLAGARGAADAAQSQAQIDRDAALARLERQLALRKSMPAGFFMTAMGG